MMLVVRSLPSTVAVDSKSNTEIRFFHPRQDEWDKHFQVDTVSGKIESNLIFTKK